MRRGRGIAALLLLYAAWLLVPASLYGSAYTDGGGLDGPCRGNGHWASRVGEPGSIRQESLSWPPLATRCVANQPDGSTQARTFPGPGTYVAVLALLVAPFPAWRLAKAVAKTAVINRPS